MATKKQYLDQKNTAWNGHVLTLAWTDGSQQQFDASMIPGFSHELTATALDVLMHGLKQKVRDDASDANNQPDPIGYSRNCAQEIFDNLVAGNFKRQGSVGTKVTDLINALYRCVGEEHGGEVSMDECTKRVLDMSAADRNQLSNHPEVAMALAEIATERAEQMTSSGIDIRALFNS